MSVTRLKSRVNRLTNRFRNFFFKTGSNRILTGSNRLDIRENLTEPVEIFRNRLIFGSVRLGGFDPKTQPVWIRTKKYCITLSSLSLMK